MAAPPDPRTYTIEFDEPNIWHTPLPDNAPLISGTLHNQLISDMNNWIRGSDVNRVGAWANVEWAEFSFKMYICDNSRNVYFTNGAQVGSGPIALAVGSGGHSGVNTAPASAWAGDGWPLQHAEIIPEVGERHISMWNRDSGEYMECMDYSRSGGSFSYGWMGYIQNTRAQKGMQMENADGVRNNYGTTMLGGPMQAAIISDHEWRSAVANYQAGDFANAYIPHCIAYECWQHTANTWNYPATRTDWTGSAAEEISWPGQCLHNPKHRKVSAYGVGGCPNLQGRHTSVHASGQMWRLLNDFDPQTQTFGGLTGDNLMCARILARTLQKHGMVNTDWSGKSFSFLVEPRGSMPPFGTPTVQHELGEHWIIGLMSWGMDSGKLRAVNTGRNYEADGIGTEADAIAAGLYRASGGGDPPPPPPPPDPFKRKNDSGLWVGATKRVKTAGGWVPPISGGGGGGDLWTRDFEGNAGLHLDLDITFTADWTAWITVEMDSMPSGASDVAWLWQMLDGSNNHRVGAFKRGQDDWTVGSDLVTYPFTVNTPESDGWQLIVLRHRASDGIAGSRYVWQTEAWSHNSPTGTVLTTPGAVSSVWLGSDKGTGSFFDGRIATFGVAKAYLSNGDVEDLHLSGQHQLFLAAANAGEVFFLDQDNETTSVTGESMGETQIARTNTNAVQDSPLGFNY